MGIVDEHQRVKPVVPIRKRVEQRYRCNNRHRNRPYNPEKNAQLVRAVHCRRFVKFERQCAEIRGHEKRIEGGEQQRQQQCEQ